MKIQIFHNPTAAVVATWYSDAVPSVGDTVSFTGHRSDCRTIKMVDWTVYVAKERGDEAAQVELITLTQPISWGEPEPSANLPPASSERQPK
jgi:hypothetical protein